jgi:hypothetical protein
MKKIGVNLFNGKRTIDWWAETLILVTLPLKRVLSSKRPPDGNVTKVIVVCLSCLFFVILSIVLMGMA